MPKCSLCPNQVTLMEVYSLKLTGEEINLDLCKECKNKVMLCIDSLKKDNDIIKNECEGSGI